MTTLRLPLEAAARAMRDVEGAGRIAEAAACIAAFLRTLPEDTAYTMVPLPLHLAAAVLHEAETYAD